MKDCKIYRSLVLAKPKPIAPNNASKLPLSNSSFDDFRFTITTPGKIRSAPKNWMEVNDSLRRNDEASTVKRALDAKMIVKFEASIFFNDLKISTLENA